MTDNYLELNKIIIDKVKTPVVKTQDDIYLMTIPTGIHYLSGVFNDLPKGFFIDKQVCGTGGTTLAIESPTNYVIAVHRSLLVDNKYVQHKNVLIKVNGDISPVDLREEIICSGKNKIITTYDSLPKVAQVLKECGKLKDFHLLVDEVQNVIREGGDFRDVVCNALLENTLKFQSVSYLTATSTEREYLPEQIKDIPYLKIDWEDSINIKVNQRQVKGNLTEQITAIALEHLDNPKDKGEAYFFFNSVKGIIPIVRNLIKLRKVSHKDIKIICANDEDNVKLIKSIHKDYEIGKPVIGVDDQGKPILDNKTITFITKTCFEGVDYYSEHPTTYIISDAKNKAKHFVKTDIAIDLRQIAGRFRGDSPMYQQEVFFLWTGQYDGYGQTEEEYKTTVLNNIEKAKNTIELFNQGKIDTSLDFLARTSKYYTRQSKDDSVVIVNKLAFSNVMSEYRTQHEDFKIVVEGGKELSKLSSRLNSLYDTDDYIPPSLKIKDKDVLGKKQNFKELALEYYETREDLEACSKGGVDCHICSDDDIESLKLNLSVLESLSPTLKEYVDELGYEVLRTCGFQESKIKAKFKKSIGVGKVVTTPSKIHKILKYSIGERHTLKKIKDDLNSAYTKLKIKNIAKAVDVEQYYNVKRTKINGNMGYRILGGK